MYQRIPTDRVIPSPFQHRRNFDPVALDELAQSIRVHGLLEPVLVRGGGQRFELIAGERRWRAARMAGLAELDARLVECDDLTARRLCLEENLHRSDLTEVELVWAIAELLDAHLTGLPEYAPFSGDNAAARVGRVLKRRSDEWHSPERFSGQICPEGGALATAIDQVFASLPRRKGWESYLRHDLPLTKVDLEIQQIAMDRGLNKAQVKALSEIKKADAQAYRELVDEGLLVVEHQETAEGSVAVPVTRTVRELSASELRELATGLTTDIPVEASSDERHPVASSATAVPVVFEEVLLPTSAPIDPQDLLTLVVPPSEHWSDQQRAEHVCMPLLGVCSLLSLWQFGAVVPNDQTAKAIQAIQRIQELLGQQLEALRPLTVLK